MQPIFSDPPQKNDALFMLGAASPKPFVFSYVQESVEVVYGPSCKKERELCLDRCINDAVPVRRRRSGGGPVVLSAGMVITVVVGLRKRNEGPLVIFSAVHDAMIAVIDPRKTLNIQKEGISDLAIGGRKILGSSLYMQHSPFLYYYQSSLMVSFDRGLFSKYLAPPLKQPLYRQGRSHERFCTTLSREGCAVSPETIARRFNEDLPRFL